MSVKRSKLHPPLESAPRPTPQQVELLAQEERENNPVESVGGQLIPITLEVLPLHAPLPCGIYLKVAGRFVLFRNAGERLTNDRMVSLQQKGATTVYIHKKSWQLFLETMEASAVGEKATPLARAEYVRGMLLVYGQELEKKIKDPKKPALDVLKTLAGQLADTLALDPAVGGKLLRRHRDPQLYFIEHSINSAVYATLVGQKLGVTGENLRQLAFGALMHDAGFLHIPKHIAYSPNPLTPEQEDEYRDHTRKGAELLQSVGASPSVVLCAFQHHEREDGNGYPGRLAGNKVHLHAKIVGIADTFDDLVGPHPGKNPMSPAEAVQAMRRMRGRFDPKLVEVVSGATEEK